MVRARPEGSTGCAWDGGLEHAAHGQHVTANRLASTRLTLFLSFRRTLLHALRLRALLALLSLLALLPLLALLAFLALLTPSLPSQQMVRQAPSQYHQASWPVAGPTAAPPPRCRPQ